MTDHARRSRLVGLSVRQQSWELEALKERNSQAATALQVANEALQTTESEISATESTLREMMQGDTVFNITAVQNTQGYLVEQQEKGKALRSDAKRAAQRAEQAEQQLKYASLTIKALEQVKDTSDRIISREQEKRLLEENVELWIQRADQGGYS